MEVCIVPLNAPKTNGRKWTILRISASPWKFMSQCRGNNRTLLLRISCNSRKMFHSRRRLLHSDKTFPDLERHDNNVGTYALISSTTSSTLVQPRPRYSRTVQTRAHPIAKSSVYPGWKLFSLWCLHLPATRQALRKIRFDRHRWDARNRPHRCEETAL